MVAVFTQLLYILVRKRIPNGSRCFRIRRDNLSGPSAFEFLDSSETCVDVITTFGSDGDFCRLCRMVLDYWEGFFLEFRV